MDTIERVVIVGGGLAAAHCAESLRESNFDGHVSLVGAEPHAPYERPPLSKDLLLAEGDSPDPTVHPNSWYSDHDIDLLTGVRAAAIDRAEQQLTLESGESLDYDALVVATGSQPRVPSIAGADRGLYLRTIEDSQRLLDTFATDAHLVIVGGGWIGLEVAAAARSHGVAVTVLEMAELPLRGVLGDELAQHLSQLHRSNGVDIRTLVKVDEIVLDGDAPVGVRVGNEVIGADHVLVAIGADPDVTLAEQAGLDVDGGIVVDQHFRSSDPSIYAIGDVAKAFNVAAGRHLRVEHWDNAIRQGKAVAANLAGANVEYDWHPYFFTDQFDFGMEYVGLGSPDDTVTVVGDLASNEFIAYWQKADAITAAMNVGIWDVNEQLRGMIGHEVDAARLTALTES